MPPVGADQLLLTPRDIQLLFYPEYLGYTFRIIWENTEALRSFFRGFQSSRRIDTRTPKLNTDAWTTNFEVWCRPFFWKLHSRILNHLRKTGAPQTPNMSISTICEEMLTLPYVDNSRPNTLSDLPYHTMILPLCKASCI